MDDSRQMGEQQTQGHVQEPTGGEGSAREEGEQHDPGRGTANTRVPPLLIFDISPNKFVMPGGTGEEEEEVEDDAVAVV